MPNKRQLHVIVPWGDPSQESDAILLMELPEDEPYAFTISHTSANTVVVAIHSGKASETAERWCKTNIFTLTNGGEINRATYEGKQDIIGENSESNQDTEQVYQANNWQEWAYQREIQPKEALDDFAREFQREYLNNDAPANQPSLDSTAEDYLDFKTVTISAKQSVQKDNAAETGYRGYSVRAFALDDNALDELKTKVKIPGVLSVNSTMKAPVNPKDRNSGARIQAHGRGLDWSETRYNESKARILGVSTFAEDI